MSGVRESAEDMLSRAGLSRLRPEVEIAIAVLLAGAVIWAGVRWAGGSDAEACVYEVAEETEGAPAAGDFAQEYPEESDAEVVVEVEHQIVVHVAGCVERPGLIELLTGSRVGDAIEAAGGARAEASLDSVNLARILTDGEQIYIPSAAQIEAGVVAPPTVGGASGGSGSVLVDINSATATELEQLPGIGPATAQKIIEERSANGPFSSAEDLVRVSGIGEKRVEDLRDLVTVR